jgi:hypothetical protein
MDMELSKYIAFISLLLVSTQGIALNLAEINQPIEQGLYDSRSCNDLYIQASTLEKEAFAYKKGIGARTQVASIVTTIFAPAVYYLGFSAFQDYKSGINSKIAFVEIEEIRFRMAEKRCFAK